MMMMMIIRLLLIIYRPYYPTQMQHNLTNQSFKTEFKAQIKTLSYTTQAIFNYDKLNIEYAQCMKHTKKSSFFHDVSIVFTLHSAYRQ